MIFVLLVVQALAVAPPLVGPRPMPGIIPTFKATGPDSGGYWHRKGWTWSRLPNRRTKLWNGISGLRFCDDPDCYQCNRDVYPPNVAPDFQEVPIRRAKD